MKKKKKDSKYGALMVLIVTAVLLLTIVLTDSPEQVFATIKTANPFWLLLAVACYLVYWFIDSLALHWLILRLGSKKYSLAESIRTTITGTFFSCLTPSSTGGQPMQIMRMQKRGVSVGRSTAILTMRFIFFQCGLSILSIVLLIMRYGYFQSRVSGFRVLVVIGLVVNIVAAVLLLMASLYPKIAHWAVGAVTRLLVRLRLVRHREEALKKVDNTIAEFAEWPKLIKGDRKLVVSQLWLTFAQMLAYFTVAFFVFKAIGAGSADLLLVLTAAACVWLASAFIPLPGGSGSAEGMFVLFFATIYRDSSVGVALLLWRFVTFYLPIIVGGVMLFLENQKKLKIKPLVSK